MDGVQAPSSWFWDGKGGKCNAILADENEEPQGRFQIIFAQMEAKYQAGGRASSRPRLMQSAMNMEHRSITKTIDSSQTEAKKGEKLGERERTFERRRKRKSYSTREAGAKSGPELPLMKSLWALVVSFCQRICVYLKRVDVCVSIASHCLISRRAREEGAPEAAAAEASIDSLRALTGSNFAMGARHWGHSCWWSLGTTSPEASSHTVRQH